MRVINKPITVVIFSVVGNFVFVDPYIIVEIFVIDVNPRINNCYNNGLPFFTN